MTYKRCHTVTTKLTNVCYLKTYELKALDCQLKATSAFLHFRIEVGRHIIILSARSIKFLKKEIKYFERELKQLVNLLDYQLETMPGIELVTASALIAEIGDVKLFTNANKLARFAGIAPVYFGSGGKGKTHKSKQGNRALHALFYNLAVQQVQVAKVT